jgi:hypothetical protein
MQRIFADRFTITTSDSGSGYTWKPDGPLPTREQAPNDYDSNHALYAAVKACDSAMQADWRRVQSASDTAWGVTIAGFVVAAAGAAAIAATPTAKGDDARGGLAVGGAVSTSAGVSLATAAQLFRGGPEYVTYLQRRAEFQRAVGAHSRLQRASEAEYEAVFWEMVGALEGCYAGTSFSTARNPNPDSGTAAPTASADAAATTSADGARKQSD